MITVPTYCHLLSVAFSRWYRIITLFIYTASKKKKIRSKINERVRKRGGKEKTAAEVSKLLGYHMYAMQLNMLREICEFEFISVTHIYIHTKFSLFVCVWLLFRLAYSSSYSSYCVNIIRQITHRLRLQSVQRTHILTVVIIVISFSCFCFAFTLFTFSAAAGCCGCCHSIATESIVCCVSVYCVCFRFCCFIFAEYIIFCYWSVLFMAGIQ